jgi:ribonuclease HII
MRLIAGIDEVGRGPLAGPVVAAAVILPSALVAGLADSKTLSAAQRAALAAELRAVARIGIGAASTREIDRLNILQATFLAMRRALLRLGCAVDLALVDGKLAPPLPCPVRAVIGGDATEPAISAASIIAKVTRDRLMQRLAGRYPGYGWERNVGYPTEEHRAALGALGPCRHHRASFAPVRLCLAGVVQTGERPAGPDRPDSP